MINLGGKSLYKIMESLRFSVSSVPYTSKYFVQTLKQLCSSLLCFVTQLCQILCDLMDCSLPGSSVLGDSPGKNTGVGCHALLQGIFPTQGSNPDLPHGSRFFLLSETPGKPKNPRVGSLSLLQKIFLTQVSNQVSCIAGGFFTS